MEETEVIKWAGDLLDETYHFWETEMYTAKDGDTKKALRSGFAVFYSPPRLHPDIMIIGVNPGGGQDSFDERRARRIPPTHEYIAYENDSHYPIARCMCGLFGPERRSLLEQSVKLNLNFFRTRSESTENNQDRRELGLKDLDRLLDYRLSKFSHQKVEDIIDKLQPRVVLAESIGTFDILRKFNAFHDYENLESVTHESGHKSLDLRRGAARGGNLLLGIRHPTGSRPPVAKQPELWAKIKDTIARDLANVGL